MSARTCGFDSRSRHHRLRRLSQQRVPAFPDSDGVDETVRRYRALIKSSSGQGRGTVLHLIRDDAETSLCGIPRAQLGAAGGYDELVCEECIEWLPKRLNFSDEHRRIERPA